MSSLIRPWPRMPTRPLVANGIATTSATPTTATIAPTRTVPSGARLRSRTRRAATSASPVAIAAVTPWPGSFTAIPQTTSSAERPTAGPAAECRGRPAAVMIAAPSRSEAPAISAPARRAENTAEA